MPRSVLAVKRGGGMEKRVKDLEAAVNTAKSTLDQLRTDHTALARRV